MRLGFTGTRAGMTPAQQKTVYNLLMQLSPDIIMHGDASGADSEFNTLALIYKAQHACSIWHYPATKGRAYNEGADQIMPQKQPLNRNIDIVNECDKLIATPRETIPQFRGGTWSTYRHALRSSKITYLVLPDGSIK